MRKALIFPVLLAVVLFSCSCVQEPSERTDEGWKLEVSDILLEEETQVSDGPDVYQTADVLSRYLTLRGVPTSYEDALRALERNDSGYRTDGRGVYLTACSLVNGKKGVISSQKDNFRFMPVPIMVLCGDKWEIMVFTSELTVKCLDSHGEATVDVPPTKFEMAFFDSGREAVYVTDLGYSYATM